MEDLEKTLSGETEPYTAYKGFEIYNPKPDLMPQKPAASETPEDEESYVPISSNVKKAVAGIGVGGSLILGGGASSIPYPYDLIAIIASPFLAFAGFASYMSYEQVKNPPKYSSFIEMLAHFKEDTEPKNRVYQYFKKRFGNNELSPIGKIIERHEKRKELSQYLDESN